MFYYYRATTEKGKEILKEIEEKCLAFKDKWKQRAKNCTSDEINSFLGEKQMEMWDLLDHYRNDFEPDIQTMVTDYPKIDKVYYCLPNTFTVEMLLSDIVIKRVEEDYTPEEIEQILAADELDVAVEPDEDSPMMKAMKAMENMTDEDAVKMAQEYTAEREKRFEEYAKKHDELVAEREEAERKAQEEAEQGTEQEFAEETDEDDEILIDIDGLVDEDEETDEDGETFAEETFEDFDFSDVDLEDITEEDNEDIFANMPVIDDIEEGGEETLAEIFAEDTVVDEESRTDITETDEVEEKVTELEVKETVEVVYKKGMSVLTFLKKNPSINTKEQLLEYYTETKLQGAIDCGVISCVDGKYIVG